MLYTIHAQERQSQLNALIGLGKIQQQFHPKCWGTKQEILTFKSDQNIGTAWEEAKKAHFNRSLLPR